MKEQYNTNLSFKFVGNAIDDVVCGRRWRESLHLEGGIRRKGILEESHAYFFPDGSVPLTIR